MVILYGPPAFGVLMIVFQLPSAVAVMAAGVESQLA